jgi:hypothetical protein
MGVPVGICIAGSRNFERTKSTIDRTPFIGCTNPWVLVLVLVLVIVLSEAALALDYGIDPVAPTAIDGRFCGTLPPPRPRGFEYEYRPEYEYDWQQSFRRQNLIMTSLVRDYTV